MRNATIHVKVEPELAESLKRLSRKRKTPVGELVRQAVRSCYQLDLLSLNETHRRAVVAFQGGYISLGKLAEEMGTTAWDTRRWLEEHDIAQNIAYLDDDVKNA